MPPLGRLLSHPLVVTALQSGALFTTQMQKEREEEEKRNQEMRLKAFEEQQRQLDRDQTRQQELADQATQTKFGSLTQNLGPSASLEDVTAARELAAGLGPAGLPYVQMADAKMQVLQKQREEQDAAKKKQQEAAELEQYRSHISGETGLNSTPDQYDQALGRLKETQNTLRKTGRPEMADLLEDMWERLETGKKQVVNLKDAKINKDTLTADLLTELYGGMATKDKERVRAALVNERYASVLEDNASAIEKANSWLGGGDKTPVEEGSAAAKGFLRAQAETNAKAQAEAQTYGQAPVFVPLDTAAAGELGRTIEGIARSDSLVAARRNAPVLPDTTRPPPLPAPKTEEQAPGFTYTPDAGIQYTPPLSPAARASQVAAGLLPASGAGAQPAAADTALPSDIELQGYVGRTINPDTGQVFKTIEEVKAFLLKR